MIDKRKRNYYLSLLPYVFGVVYFSYIFIRIPTVSDRWWSEFIYDMENTWRIVLSQIYWAEHANGRVLSTLFAMIVDRNIYFRGFVNAGMLMLLCYLTVSGIPSKVSERREGMLSCFAISLMVLMSFRIKSQVYFYSATLFISSALLIVLSIVLMLRSFYGGEKENNRFYLYYVFILCIASLWLENVSCVLVGINIINAFVLYLKERRPNRKAIWCTIISIVGLLFLYVCMKKASNWRFNGVSFQSSSVWDIAEFVSSNIAIFLIFTFLVYILFRQEFKKSRFYKLVSVVFILILGLESILGINNVYIVVSAEYTMTMPYIWYPMKADILENVFALAINVFYYMVIPICVFLMSVLYVSLYKKGLLLEGGIITVALGVSFVFQILYGTRSGRIESLSVFMLSFLCVFLARETNFGKSMFTQSLFVGIVIIAWINFDTLYVFTHNQAKLEDERQQIADVVRNEQLLGQWDYDKIVVFPGYKTDANGRGLAIFTDLEEGDMYLEGIKKYYNLDSRTKIVYE